MGLGVSSQSQAWWPLRTQKERLGAEGQPLLSIEQTADVPTLGLRVTLARPQQPSNLPLHVAGSIVEMPGPVLGPEDGT